MNKRIQNIVAFIVLMISTALGYQLFWGLLFLYWTISNFNSGHAFLISDVSRKEDPILYWAIQIAWLVLGVWVVVGQFFPQIL